MGTKEIKTYKLDQVKDKVVGKKGSIERDTYEYELTLDVLGEMIKKARSYQSRCGLSNRCQTQII